MGLTPYHSDHFSRIFVGDCREVLAQMKDNTFDAIVTDPPYGLGFMGKEWDSFKSSDSPMRRRPEIDAVNAGMSRQGGRQRAGADYQKRQARDARAMQEWFTEWATEALRVAKPGAHLVAFGGTRTSHRLVCAIEDAGWEIRDSLVWLFGSGFPKSLDVGKALDKAAGAEREVVAHRTINNNTFAVSGDGREQEQYRKFEGNASITAPASDLARQWDGWHTALKPGHEPIVLARKPLTGTVASNVTQWGTGAINVDGCRIGTEARPLIEMNRRQMSGASVYEGLRDGSTTGSKAAGSTTQGRWPANVILDEEAAALLDATVGERSSRPGSSTGPRHSVAYGTYGEPLRAPNTYVSTDDTGGPSRFFYTSKASRAEREHGLDALPGRTPGEMTDRKDGAAGTNHPRAGAGRGLTERDRMPAWASADLEALSDTGSLLRRATAGFTRADGSEWSTMSSGNGQTEPSPQGSTSTTSTETSSTTPSETSELLTLSLIRESIQAVISAMASGLSPADFAAACSRWMLNIGISAEKAGRSMDDAANVISAQLYELNNSGGSPGRVSVRRNTHPT